MVRLLVGAKGQGKTKVLVDLTNETAKTANGHVVYIESDTKHMYDLNHKVRFISAHEYSIYSKEEFFGFLCGISAQDSDIEKIFITGLTKILRGLTMEDLEVLVPKLKSLSEKSNFELTIHMTCKQSDIPESLKPLLVDL